MAIADIPKMTKREDVLREYENQTKLGAYDPGTLTILLIQLHHLDADEQGQRMLNLTGEIRNLTRRMLWFTVAVTALTVVNVIAVLCH